MWNSFSRCRRVGLATSRSAIPLLRLLLHSVLQVHALLVVVCDERSPRASAARCFTWRQGTRNRTYRIRKCLSSEIIAKIPGAFRPSCSAMLLPNPLNAMSGHCFRCFCVGVRTCPAPEGFRAWVLPRPSLDFNIIHVLNGAPLDLLGDDNLFSSASPPTT